MYSGIGFSSRISQDALEGCLYSIRIQRASSVLGLLYSSYDKAFPYGRGFRAQGPGFLCNIAALVRKIQYNIDNR